MNLFKTTFSSGLMAVLGITSYANVSVAEEVEIAVVDIPGLFEKGETGLYDKVVQAVGAKNGVTYKLTLLPPKRAVKAFEIGQAPCHGPANSNPDFYSFGFDTVESPSMTDAKVYIFSAPGKAATANLDDIKGMKVGGRAGMPYGNKVDNANLGLKLSNDIKANIKKAQSGRLDYFIAYTPDIYTAFDELGMDPLPHVKDKPISIHYDRIVCRGDQAGSAIIKKFNEGYKAIEADGTLDKIFE